MIVSPEPPRATPNLAFVPGLLAASRVMLSHREMFKVFCWNMIAIPSEGRRLVLNGADTTAATGGGDGPTGRGWNMVIVKEN